MNIQETQKYAEDLAMSVGVNRRIFALVGDLGAGKTTFSQFFLRALGVADPITSPTFVIMKHYLLSTAHYPLSSAYHMDCYRLKSSAELPALSFVKILADEKNIILIEWADLIRNALPDDTVWIDFIHGVVEEERIIELNSKSETRNSKT